MENPTKLARFPISGRRATSLGATYRFTLVVIAVAALATGVLASPSTTLRPSAVPVAIALNAVVVALSVRAFHHVARRIIEAADSARRIEFESRALAESQANASARQRDQSDRRTERLAGVLGAAHHELNREITQLGFTVDDMAENAEQGIAATPDTVAELIDAFALVDEGQQNIAALARLGADDVTDRSEIVCASQLIPRTTSLNVIIGGNESIRADRGLLRLFVKNAARNAESHGQAHTLTLFTGNGRLRILDDGLGCRTEDLARGWNVGVRPDGSKSEGTQIMRRIADAHRATVGFKGEPGRGVEISLDLDDRVEVDEEVRNADASRSLTSHQIGDYGHKVDEIAGNPNRVR